jgi:SAM-dependent methyltransferase
MTERYSSAKVLRYQSLLSRLLSDVWTAGRPVRWLDVGAGYGEVVSAVMRLAPPGSVVQGLEPMIPKVRAARNFGIDLRPEFLGDQDAGQFNFVSAINVFSHVNDPRGFISKLAATLAPGGEIVLETGDMEDVLVREEFPGLLDLPDHVGFATKANVESLLTECGLKVVRFYRLRIDGVALLAKSVAKRFLGRHSIIGVPYRSPYRRLVVRAKHAMR